MKNLITNIILIFSCLTVLAQDIALDTDLPGIAVNPDVTLHIISPDNIRFAEISSPAIKVALAEKNIVQVKVLSDSIVKYDTFTRSAILTIVGEHFITQYRLYPSNGHVVTRIYISASEMKALDTNTSSLSGSEMRNIAFSLAKRKPNALKSATSNGLKGQVNQIVTTGDYLFLDLSWHNRTGLKYDTESLRFFLEDKKTRKASNQQSLPVVPLFSLYKDRSFRQRFRNIYVIPKMTFAASKVLRIELSEKQISGRNLNMKLNNRDLLEADTW